MNFKLDVHVGVVVESLESLLEPLSLPSCCFLREVVRTSVLNEDPPCLVVEGGGGQNLLALKFEMRH